jgi:hypothetical protein
MGIKEKVIKLLRVLLLPAWQVVAYCLRLLMKNLSNVAMVIQIIFPVWLVCQNIEPLKAFIYSVAIVFILAYIRQLYTNVQKHGGKTIPIPRQRFTVLDEDGYIVMKNDNAGEAIQYLYELEEYLSNRGKLK